MNSLIEKYVKFTVKRYKLVVLMAIVLLFGSLFLASTLQLDNSLEGMIPEGNIVMEAMQAMEDEFGSQDQVLVAVKGEDSSRIKEYLDYLATAIEDKQIATSILYKVELEEFTHYFASESQSLFLMSISPDINFDQFIEERELFFSTLFELIEESTALTAFSGIQAGVTGGTLVQDYESDKKLEEGFLLTGLMTLLLIITIFVLSFRRIILPLTTVLPLLLGVTLTAGFAALAFDGLNMLSISFAVLLLGMGIDYAIHILSRFGEQRAHGDTVEEALINTIQKTGLSMFIGSLTTALAFSSFLFASMKAFTQMGIISSIGIFLAMLSQLFVTPALIAWSEHRGKGKERKEVHFNFMRPIGSFVNQKGIIIYAAVAILMVATFSNVLGVNISSDMSSLYPDDIPSLEWLEIVQQEFDYNPNEITIMAKDLEELAAFTETLSAMSHIETVESIVEYLPADKSLWGAALPHLPTVITDNFVGNTGKFLIKVTTNADVWDRENMTNVLADLHSVTTYVSGLPIIMFEIIGMVIEDAFIITLMAAVAIFFVFIVTFRSIKYALVNMIPIVGTLYLLFGLLPVFNITLSIISVIALPLVIGIGVAGAVHISNRIKITGNIEDTLVFTGKAVILSAVTTLVGFGSLMFAGHPALADLGKLVSLGLAISLILNVTLLPSILAKFIKKEEQTVNDTGMSVSE